MKSWLKKTVKSVPALWAFYWLIKSQVKRVFLLRYFLYDIWRVYCLMYWSGQFTGKTTLSAELLFQYHKLEKGLVMPGPRRMFGAEAASATMALCRRWIANGLPRRDPVFLGAIESLAAYRSRILSLSLIPQPSVLDSISKFLDEVPERAPELATPRPLIPERNDKTANSLRSFVQLAEMRRSVREFLPQSIEPEIFERAVRAAQLAPSACNRQPCRLWVISDAEKIKLLLSFQNGNRGFGHLAPHVAILTSDEACFFDASERHEPYVDGGLFAMSLILALCDNGVSSCCLNWCVPPKNDRAVRQIFRIPRSERIIMLLAYGRAPANCHVPRSPRRDLAEVVKYL